MSDYERMLIVRAPADRVFDFASDIGNLPLYLPGVREAAPAGAGRIRMQGETAGEQYDVEARFHVDRSGRRLEWGSEGDSHYAGWLHVQEGDVTPEFSEVTIHLSFRGTPSEGQPTRRDEDIQDSIEQALESIRDAVEAPAA